MKNKALPPQSQALRLIPVARVSTKEQADHGTSLESQTAANLAYIERIGAVALQPIEEDVTGTSKLADRPNGTRIYKLLRSKQADGLVFYTSDRFTRDLVTGLVDCRDLLAEGFQLHFTDHGQVKSADDIVFLIGSWKSAQERKSIIKRTTAGLWGKAKAGKVVGTGGPPYGYKIVNDALVIHEPEAEVIRQIFRWYTLGDEKGRAMTVKAIADKLHENATIAPGVGRRKRTQADTKWSADTINTFLSSETYIGRWHYGQTKHEGGRKVGKRDVSEQAIVHVPPIIDRTTFEAAQKRKVKNQKAAARRTIHEYLLRGRVRCKCGSAMCGRCTKGKYFYYLCTNDTKHGQPLIIRDVLDDLVWKQVMAVLMSDGFEDDIRAAQAERQSKAEPNTKALKHTEKRIAELERNAKRIAAAMGKQPVNSPVYRALEVEAKEVNSQYEKLALKRDELAAELAEIELSDDRLADLDQFRQTVLDRLKSPTFEDKRMVLEVFDVTVTVDGFDTVTSIVIDDNVFNTVTGNLRRTQIENGAGRRRQRRGSRYRGRSQRPQR